MSEMSTYNRTLALFRSMSHRDRADAINEILVDYRYDLVGQSVLGHCLDTEALECIDNMRRLMDEGRTASDEFNARRLVA